MSKKIIISIFIIITIFQTTIPNKVYATEAGVLDTATGIILEPTLELFTVIIDAVMQIFTSVMTQEDYQFVMLPYNELPSELKPSDEEEIPTITLTQEDMEAYSGFLIFGLKYPNFSYSPEEIFSGKINLLDINFFHETNEDTNWGKIRAIISRWYSFLKNVAIIGLLSVLIYTGIKIILSSNAQSKSKYKEMLLNWFMAVIILFAMQYIMAFILNIIETIILLFEETSGNIKVVAGDKSFKTNLIGFARFQLQQDHFSAKVGHLVIYTALVTYTFKFTFVYLKRVLRMAFLTLIAPIVALTYPLDKMEGQAKGFNMWLKEYMFTALLQPLHYILYYILVISSITLAARNPLYGIAALMFMAEAERLLKKIFSFGKGGENASKGVAQAFATGAIVSQVNNMVRNPLHPFSGFFGGGGNGKNGSGSSGNILNDDEEQGEITSGINEDTVGEDNLLNMDLRGRGAPGVPTLPNIDDFFTRYRAGLPTSTEDLGGLHFDDGVHLDLDSLLNEICRREKQLGDEWRTPEDIEKINSRIFQLENTLKNRVEQNEMDFTSNGIPLQYADGDSRSTMDILKEIKELKRTWNDPTLSQAQKNANARRANQLLKTVKRRMAQNQYIERQGGVLALKQQEQARIDHIRDSMTPEQRRQLDAREKQNKETNNKEKRELPPQLKGMKHVAKTLAKPIWDSEKKVKYNSERLVGKIIKGTAGIGIGIAAAAVQAGISITDGKYNIAEGVATVGAGMVGASKIGQTGKGIARTYKEGKNDGIEGRTAQEYGERWFNRDDVIREYNREFPGQGKEMRKRAVDNYISRGITDSKEQIQALKYADTLIKERGIKAEEADKIAIATLQYRQSLIRNRNYVILFDEEKRNQYLEITANAYRGYASKDSIKRLHDDLIQNVRDFEQANE